jgi:glycine cleavage system H protein
MSRVETPDDVRYTREHEWARDEGEGKVRVGITDYAQDALGDVVYVDLPDVGLNVVAGSTCAEVESTKSVSEIYAPVTGTVIEVNSALVDEPELVNQDPYGRGWILFIEMAATDEVGTLLDASAYRAMVEHD